MRSFIAKVYLWWKKKSKPFLHTRPRPDEIWLLIPAQNIIWMRNWYGDALNKVKSLIVANADLRYKTVLHLQVDVYEIVGRTADRSGHGDELNVFCGFVRRFQIIYVLKIKLMITGYSEYMKIEYSLTNIKAIRIFNSLFLCLYALMYVEYRQTSLR